MGSLDEKAEAIATSRPHVVCVPFPAQGHIRPAFKLAKLLHSKGVDITFVNTEFNHERLLRSRGPNSLDGLPQWRTPPLTLPTFRFEAIPDGLPPSDLDATQDIPSVVYAVLNNCLEPFKNLIQRLNDPSSGRPPVNLILSDCIMTFSHDAGRDLGLPVVLFWTASACGFMGYAQYQYLQNTDIVPFKDPNYLTNGCLDIVIDWVPSMKGIRLKDIPSFIRTMDKDDLMVKFVMICIQRCCESKAPIIFNTYYALEHEVLDDIAKMVGPIYSIGPLQLLEKYVVSEHNEEVETLGCNLWKENTECLQWLDSQEPNSVVYVSFGSITTMTKDQLVEFAWGLANSKRPFLWIVRPDIVKGDQAIIPPEFLEETIDRGILAGWCDQEAVLNHPSTCVFLTHCGWNSTLETICVGNPVLCWPFFGEQLTNCWYFCKKWGIGLEINNDVKREEVEEQVRELMEGEKGKQMKNKALDWKRLAEEAVASPNGSSIVDFDKLINQVLVPLQSKAN